MIFTAITTAISTVASSHQEMLNVPTTHFPPKLRADYDPPVRSRTEYVFRTRILPLEGGRVLLRLYADPVVAVERDSMQCEVLRWGIKLPAVEVENIPRLMTRRFLELFSKADAGILSEQEESAWMEIVDQVDYAAFCSDRAAPRYVEGTYLNRSGRKCRVEWHDGEKETLTAEAARSLNALVPGDRFAGYAKLGRDGTARLLERITLLPAA